MADVSFLLRATEFRAKEDGSFELVILLTPCQRGSEPAPTTKLRVLADDVSGAVSRPETTSGANATRKH